MNPVISALLTRCLLGIAKKLNKEELHRFAAECKKKDIEAGYDTYKNDSSGVDPDGGNGAR